MIESLLVPFDGTEGARHALEQADIYAQRLDVAVDLLVVGSPGLESQDRAELQYEAGRLDARVGEVTVLTGDDVAAAIVRSVDNRPTTQLWMATHGRSRLGGLVLGSTAEAVIHDSRRPSALIGHHARARPTAGFVALCVIDLVPSTSLIAAAAWWAGRLSCPLRIMAVTASLPSSALPPPVAGQLAQNLDEASVAAGMEPLRGDNPADAITQYVQHEAVQVLAMPTHARSGVRRALAGTVAMSIVHRAPCPVIVQADDGGDP